MDSVYIYIVRVYIHAYVGMYERESLASTKVFALAVYGGLWFMVYGLWFMKRDRGKCRRENIWE